MIIMKEQTKKIANINDINIVFIEGVEKFVPIRPLCDILKINHSSQITKIKNDEILGSRCVLRTTLSADGKDREMFCLPYMYTLGWLFTINPKNVKEEAREIILTYKMKCYTALFNYFSHKAQFLEQKQKALEKQIDEVERIRSDYSDQQNLLANAKKTFNDIKEMTFEQWQMNKRQLFINFQN